MKPLISIIVPVYNCEKYISKLVDSINNQTYQNFELFLIDDGSTDNTSLVLQKLKSSNERIKVIFKKNSGVSDTRNYGLKIANGKYIIFLDADDYVEKNYLEDMMNIMNKYKPELIIQGYYSETDTLKNYKLDTISMKEKYYNNKASIKEDLVEMWDRHLLYNIWNKVYVKKIIDDNNIKFPEYNWGEDIEFNRLYLLNINTAYNTSNCYYHYIRERNGAVTNKYQTNLFEIRKKEFYEFNEYFEKWNISKNNYYEFSCRRYIERILGCIENTYSSDSNFKNRYQLIKSIINDPLTRETIQYIKPRSKKIKIMIIPIRLKLILTTMLMGKIINIIKSKYPDIFNKLKNKR